MKVPNVDRIDDFGYAIHSAVGVVFRAGVYGIVVNGFVHPNSQHLSAEVFVGLISLVGCGLAAVQIRDRQSSQVVVCPTATGKEESR